MNILDKSKKFVSVNIGLITISDTRNLKNDKSGDLLKDRILKIGHNLKIRKCIKDDIALIKNTILEFINKKSVDIIITSGGTGLTGRDSTPEAVISIADKKIEGFGELFRQISYKKIGTSTIQSRALGVIVKGVYVFCLPGSPNACKDAWDDILINQLDIRYRPCNFIELIPRLNEFK
tara:strand:+ start:646 stop:1179 length:534 start_codon:yes stop_codon:yes gene_type:complete